MDELLPHIQQIEPFMDELLLHMNELLPHLDLILKHADKLIPHTKGKLQFTQCSSSNILMQSFFLT
jgi:hypothetical protein